MDYKLSNGKYEFYLEERIKFTDGDEIWEVFNDGTQRLRGVYKNNSFIIIESIIYAVKTK